MSTTIIQTEQEKQTVLDAYHDLLKSCSIEGEQNKKIVDRSFVMANEAHSGMRRKSGEPYILHPIAVAKIVAEEIGLDSTSVVCALLHDVVEDTDITLDDISREFNKQIAQIIDGLTKIKGVFEEKGWVEQQAASVRKILLTLGQDVRVILIKLADRMHNMRTMESMPANKQLRIASETLYIYAPIAHRLGLYRIKSELEDLCMKYTQPNIYKDIAKRLNEKKTERENFIEEFVAPLKKRLEENGFADFRIFGRPKHIFSIWNKIRQKQVNFDDIYDLFAIRIILNVPERYEKAECWRAYSIITDCYKPKADRLRDWISLPKANGYESLHTTVMGPHGKWIEVQLRTERMDAIAEKGVAAHWRYKGHKSQGALDKWLESVRDFLQNSDDRNAVEFVTDFQHNLYEADIFIFTPKGDLRTLPANSTVLDFAFDIHTDVGSSCIGAKIDGRLQPISRKLENGDQVEVITSKKQKPTEEWLNFTITSKARTKIKSHLNNEKRQVAESGKEALFRKLRSLKLKNNKNVINELVTYFKYQDSLDLFYHIATKELNLTQLKEIVWSGDKIVVRKEKKAETIDEEKVSKSVISENDGVDLSIFGGFADKIDYSIAHCCNPVPGDDVFGFITIGKGIRIHRSDCPNGPDLMKKYNYRIVSTKWARQSKEMMFLTKLTINGIDDVGLVNRLTSMISHELKINMRSISLDAKDGIFTGKIEVFVENSGTLNNMIKKLKEVEGIYDVKRVT